MPKDVLHYFAAQIGESYILPKYVEASNASTIQTLLSLGEAFINPNSTTILQLLRSLNNSFTTQDLTGNEFRRKRRVLNIVAYYFSTYLSGQPYAVITSIANHIVLCTPPDSIRTSLDKLINFVRDKSNLDATLPYISWIDGYDLDGITVEQWLDKNIRSTIFPVNSPVVYFYPPNNNYQIIESATDIENKKMNTDLFIDTDEDKIFLRGKKLNSSYLPSSITTALLLCKLLTKQNNILQYNELPINSYFQDRNELQSKILSPLKKAVRKYLNKNIVIKASGKLINYSIIYKSSDILIRILSRR